MFSFQAFLQNEDLGDSIDQVEALIKKQENFQKTLNAQEDKIKVSRSPHCRGWGHILASLYF